MAQYKHTAYNNTGNTAYTYGKFGEQVVVHYLLCKNFIILKKNYNCKFGEVDIICSKGNTLIFVEVKSWYYYSVPELHRIINARKLDRIRKCAELFLTNFISHTWMCARIDVILVKLLHHIMIHYKGV